MALRSRRKIKNVSVSLSHAIQIWLLFLSLLIFAVVQIDLYDRTSKIFTRAKDAFRQWDDRREAQGLGKWDILYHISNGNYQSYLLFRIHPQAYCAESLKLQLEAAPTVLEVKPRCVVLQDIHVPKFEGERLLRPSGDSTAEDVEDWHTEIAELFEWVGLACIGSDRHVLRNIRTFESYSRA